MSGAECLKSAGFELEGWCGHHEVKRRGTTGVFATHAAVAG
jgi:hypothetical protein